ncbi:DUF4366 domain-containing protein [bacterium 1XD42-1]|nr:DUF4366 domain-containing protein [bacterium 1XD42-8]RKJ61713.1 DUF4366 domain-containing protein [bacterium 1XD42-1]
MKGKKYRVVAAALCAAFLLCGITTTAYAGGGEEWEDGTGGPEWEGLDPVEPPATPEPEPEPNPFTPDGQGTMVDNATDGDGKEFFTIMAADESVFYLVIDRQRETENVYFLNAVTVADLMALAEPSPEAVPEPLPEPEKSGGAGTLLLVLAVLALGGGAGWYFKIYRPKQQAAAPSEDFEEAGEYGEDYGGGEYDDLPPWDEEEEKEDGE